MELSKIKALIMTRDFLMREEQRLEKTIFSLDQQMTLAEKTHLIEIYDKVKTERHEASVKVARIFMDLPIRTRQVITAWWIELKNLF